MRSTDSNKVMSALSVCVGFVYRTSGRVETSVETKWVDEGGTRLRGWLGFLGMGCAGWRIQQQSIGRLLAIVVLALCWGDGRPAGWKLELEFFGGCGFDSMLSDLFLICAPEAYRRTVWGISRNRNLPP